MDIRSHVIALNRRRLKINKEMQDFVDDCIARHPGERMSAAEDERYRQYNADLDAIDAEVRQFVAREEAEREAGQLREAYPHVFGGSPAPESRTDAAFRAWLRDRHSQPLNIPVRGFQRERELLRAGASPAEIRTLVWDTGSVGSAVPTEMARELYEVLEAQVSMLRAPTFKFTTDTGGPYQWPKLTAHQIGTQVIAQGTAIGGTDPTFDRLSLDAFKYGALVQVSDEVITDTSFDVGSMLAKDLGRAVGRVIDADLVVGTGTGEPRGLMVAIAGGGAGSVTTGGSLIDPTYEKLVDLVYTVNDAYRAGGSCAWLMRDSTAAAIRKLRSEGGTVGVPLWQPSLTAGIVNGAPDMLLGYPAFTDPNVASLASNARVMAFGDFSAYYIRQVRSVQLERSDDFAFDKDLATFRCKWRVDGDLMDSAAIASMVRNV